MEIIRKANILDQDDLLLLENHSLDKRYILDHRLPRKNVTKLMLLISLLGKYPVKIINDTIEKYIKGVPNEINQNDEYGYSPLMLCTDSRRLGTIKILLTYAIYINHQDIHKQTAAI